MLAGLKQWWRRFLKKEHDAEVAEAYYREQGGARLPNEDAEGGGSAQELLTHGRDLSKLSDDDE
jgi:hypothetical protein